MYYQDVKNRYLNKKENQLTSEDQQNETLPTNVQEVSLDEGENKIVSSVTNEIINKIPTYTVMAKRALKELNNIGEGCSKLEILIFILKKYKPLDEITNINKKLGKVLESGVLKGTFLSNCKIKKSLKPKLKIADKKVQGKKTLVLMKKQKTGNKMVQNIKVSKSNKNIVRGKQGSANLPRNIKQSKEIKQQKLSGKRIRLENSI